VDRLGEDSVVTGVGIDPGSKSTGVVVTTATPAGTVGLVSFEIWHRGRLISKKLEQRSNYPPVGGAGTSGTGRPGSTIGLGQRSGWRRASGTGWTRPCHPAPPVGTGKRRRPRAGALDRQKMENPEITSLVPPGYPGGTRLVSTCWPSGTGPVPTVGPLIPRSTSTTSTPRPLVVPSGSPTSHSGASFATRARGARISPPGWGLSAKRGWRGRSSIESWLSPRPHSRTLTASTPPGGHSIGSYAPPARRSQVARAHQVEPNPMLCAQDPHLRRAICVGDRSGVAILAALKDRVIASPPGGVPMPGPSQTALDSHDSGSAGTKAVHGFRTGDLTRANIPAGKYAGTHVGRVAVRTPEEIQHLHQHRECPRGRPPSLHRRLAIRKLGMVAPTRRSHQCLVKCPPVQDPWWRSLRPCGAGSTSLVNSDEVWTYYGGNLIKGRLLLGSAASRRVTLSLMTMAKNGQATVPVRPHRALRQHRCSWATATGTPDPLPPRRGAQAPYVLTSRGRPPGSVSGSC